MIGSSVGESLRDLAEERIRQLRMPTAASEDWRFVDFTNLFDSRSDCTASPRLVTNSIPIINGDASKIGQELDERTLKLERDRLSGENELPACWSWLGSVRQLVVTDQQTLCIDHHAHQAKSGWRLIIEVKAGARLDLALIHHVKPLTCASIGLVLKIGQGAHVSINEICPEPSGHFFVHVESHLERDGNLRHTSVGRGGELFRHRFVGNLVGFGAELDVAALDHVDDWNQAHRHIRIRHAVGNTRSRQLFKTVLTNRGSKTSFDGLIRIDSGADGSDAEQLSKNLILAGGARADSKPQLDVHADEVKAAHGASIGQPDHDEILYLRMRGISEPQALSLLKTGFSGEILDRLPSENCALFAS